MRASYFVVALLCLIGAARADDHSSWGYSGDHGPEYWGELDGTFSACSAGRSQSPIDIRNPVQAHLPPIEFRYTRAGKEIMNNGHTVQVSFDPGNSISVEGSDYVLKQFHFHVPSENHIDGRSFPMEAHFVHADDAGKLAVVAVMFEEGEANSELAALWRQIPAKAGEAHQLEAPVRIEALLPADRSYYRFLGSLTTPPCSEGVTWLVLKHPVSATKEQIDKLMEVLQHPNNRPIQALNTRVVSE